MIRYLERVQQQAIKIDLATGPLVGGVQNRRQGLARVRTVEARAWKVSLLPMIYSEPQAGVITDPAAGQPTKPRGYVRWGSDGVYAEAVVDYRCGGETFDVFGDSVWLEGEIPNAWLTGMLPSSIVIGGMITPGEPGGKLKRAPTYTVYAGDLIVGAPFSAAIPVPAWATSFRVYTASQNVATAWASTQFNVFGFMDALLAFPTLHLHQVAPSLEIPSVGLPIPPGTRFLQIQTIMANPARFEVEFTLDL